MAQELTKGLFITFEGPEGCGKSTHSRHLREDLLKDGYDLIHTSEPGDTAIGKKIREILLEADSLRLDDMTELMLFEADRAQHIREMIRPALSGGKIILCDRFNTATFAYQGYGLGMDMGIIRPLDEAATDGISPDLTILMDVDVETGMERARARGPVDRMEKRGLEFHERVRAGYLDMAKKDPDRMCVIDAGEDIDKVYEEVKKKVYDFIEGHKRTG